MDSEAGQTGEVAARGIPPAVSDRVVQCAVKNILEPIFEVRFWKLTCGFRPGRGCHGALEHIRQTIKPRRYGADGMLRDPCQRVIEGDMEGCFDNIGHHHPMNRVRKSCADRKVNRLILRFLKAGVLENFIYSPTAIGTPQRGVLSALLSEPSDKIGEHAAANSVCIRKASALGAGARPGTGAPPAPCSGADGPLGIAVPVSFGALTLSASVFVPAMTMVPPDGIASWPRSAK